MDSQTPKTEVAKPVDKVSATIAMLGRDEIALHSPRTPRSLYVVMIGTLVCCTIAWQQVSAFLHPRHQAVKTASTCMAVSQYFHCYYAFGAVAFAR